MKYLPRNVSVFEKLIKKNFLYIDKTEQIYNLFNSGETYFFLSRPRRFGKSLLISTLNELFSGNKELFKGLWIYDSNFAWEEHPVVFIDFGNIPHLDAVELRRSLNNYLYGMATDFELNIEKQDTPEEMLSVLVKELAKQGQVTILIDEYDKPLLDQLPDLEKAEAVRRVLKSFYDNIKSLEKHVGVIFITGVTKVSKTSIFSGLNNLTDLSESPVAASLLGYTHDEVKAYLTPYIQKIADKKKTSMDEILKEMKQWYNGYRFSSANILVYNPYSVISYLKEQKRANYWFATGTPSFLIQKIKDHIEEIQYIEQQHLQTSNFGAYDLKDASPIILLYQTGYLTIKDYKDADDEYTLTFPNVEVERSFSYIVLGMLTSLEKETLTTAVIKLRKALHKEDFAEFCQIFESLIASIPYNLHIPSEKYYHSLFHFLSGLLSLNVESEVLTSNGRIDMVVKTKEGVIIFEFKLNQDPQKGMKQILDRRYFEKYQADKITLVSLAFNIDDKKLHCSWETQKV